MKKLVLAIVIATSLLSCKKDNEIEMESTLPSKVIKQPVPVNTLTGEARHTDSLIRIGVLTDKEPSFITRHPGDDRTYDLYYGSIGTSLKATDDYIKANKWVITYKYDNYDRGSCSTTLLWHNAKSVQLGTLPKEIFFSNDFKEMDLIDGNKVLELLKKYPN